MKTVILAGGEGSRVRPLSVGKSKVMVKVVGRPLIEHVVRNVASAGMRDIIVVVGMGGEDVKAHLGDGKMFGTHIEYAMQERPLGTANALQAVENMVGEKFLVVNGDDIFEAGLLNSMVKEAESSRADIVLSCKPVKETWKFGILVKDQSCKVSRIVEKPRKGEEPSNLAVVGIYLFSKKIFSQIRKLPVSDHQLEGAIQETIESGGVVRTVSYGGFFGPFKYPWDLFSINRYLMDRFLKASIISKSAAIASTAIIDGNVFIGDGAKIMEGAVVKGPCYIGKGTIVGTNAVVREYSSVGENCIIGFSTEVVRSVIGDGCWFHNSYVGDSIIMDGCKFGAGSVTANFRFDEKSVKVNVKGQVIDSGAKKLGLIAGMNCRMGVNSSTMPGLKIGPNSTVGSGVTLQEDLEQGKTVFVDRKSYVIKENKI